MAKHLEREANSSGSKRLRIRFDDPKLGPRIVGFRNQIEIDGRGNYLLLPVSRGRRTWIIGAFSSFGLLALVGVILMGSPNSPNKAVARVSCEDSLTKKVYKIGAKDITLGGVTTQRVLCNNEPYRITVDSVRGKVIGVKKL